MGRGRKSIDEKAQSYTVSLKPGHVVQLEAIKLKTKEDRSALVQRLIEEEHQKITKE